MNHKTLWIAIILCFCIITASGCATNKSESSTSDSAELNGVSLEDAMLSRTDFHLTDSGNDRVLDVAQNGDTILAIIQDKVNIVTLDEQCNSGSMTELSSGETDNLLLITTQQEEVYIAGNSQDTVTVFLAEENGNLVEQFTFNSSQTPLDMVKARNGDFYILLGTVIENTVLNTSVIEDTVLLVMDAHGMLKTQYTNQTATERFCAVYEASDGRVLVVTNKADTDEIVTCIYSVLDNGLEHFDQLPVAHVNVLDCPFEDIMYLSSPTELHEYNVQQGTFTSVEKWANCNVNGNMVLGGSVFSSECILVCGQARSWVLRSKTATEETITIRVAVIEPYTLPIQEVLDFQDSNPGYQIETVSFADQEALNLALASGEPLDLIQIDELDATRYSFNDYFIDLAPYIENDEYLLKTDFYYELWEMCKLEDALPTVMTNFSLQGLYGPRELYGSDSALSWDAFREATQDTRFYESTVRENALMWLSSIVEVGTDEMTSEAVADLSEALVQSKLFQANFETVDYNIPGSESNLMWLNASSSQAVARLEMNGVRLWGTEELSYMGYPTERGQGISFTQSRSYAVFSGSNNQNAAWVFLRYLLLAGNEDTGISILRQKDNPILEQLISATDNQALAYSSPLISIILEEAGGYYADEKDVEDVVEIISNRARIYLAEQLP